MQNSTKTLLKYIVGFIAIESIVCGILFIIGRRVGWDSLDQYREGLQVAGMLIVGIGFFGVKGNWDITRSFNYQYSMSVSNQSSWKRTQQTLLDFAQAFRFLLSMIFIGGFNVLVGTLL